MFTKNRLASLHSRLVLLEVSLGLLELLDLNSTLLLHFLPVNTHGQIHRVIWHRTALELLLVQTLFADLV